MVKFEVLKLNSKGEIKMIDQTTLKNLRLIFKLKGMKLIKLRKKDKYKSETTGKIIEYRIEENKRIIKCLSEDDVKKIVEELTEKNRIEQKNMNEGLKQSEEVKNGEEVEKVRAIVNTDILFVNGKFKSIQYDLYKNQQKNGFVILKKSKAIKNHYIYYKTEGKFIHIHKDNFKMYEDSKEFKDSEIMNELFEKLEKVSNDIFECMVCGKSYNKKELKKCGCCGSLNCRNCLKPSKKDKGKYYCGCITCDEDFDVDGYIDMLVENGF